MSPVLKYVGVACAAMLLAGCATRYGPYCKWMKTGYKESRVSPNSFQVTFHGDVEYSRSNTIHYACLRCAEVAMEHGYACYQIYSLTIRTNTCARMEDKSGPCGMTSAFATGTNYSVSVAFGCFNRSEGDGFIDAMAEATSIRKKYRLPSGHYPLSE